jgi:hypothetical protein
MPTTLTTTAFTGFIEEARQMSLGASIFLLVVGGDTVVEEQHVRRDIP